METNNRDGTINPLVDKYTLVKELEEWRKICDEITFEINEEPDNFVLGMIKGRAFAYRKIMTQLLNGKYDFQPDDDEEENGYGGF